jgi:hypothetical protein
MKRELELEFDLELGPGPGCRPGGARLSWCWCWCKVPARCTVHQRTGGSEWHRQTGSARPLREERLEVRALVQPLPFRFRTHRFWSADIFFFFLTGDFTFVVQTSTFGGRSSIFGGPVEPKAALPPLLPCGPKERRVPGLSLNKRGR